MPLSLLLWVFVVVSVTQVAVAMPTQTSKNGASKSIHTVVEYPVDINHADVKQLMNLKGIGGKRAKAIVQYRKTHGDFKSLDDLTHIKGLTKKRLQTLLSKNQGKITVH